jgi:hypothetical protein
VSAAGNDLAAMTAFSSASIAGDPAVAQRFAVNPTEENAFFGWPLVILVVVLAIWLWSVVAVRALVVTAVVMAVFSLGGELVVNGTQTGVPLPWLAFSQVPLLDSLLGSRLSMACVPLIGILLAMACERMLNLAAHATHIPLKLLWFGSLAAVLLPILPCCTASPCSSSCRLCCPCSSTSPHSPRPPACVASSPGERRCRRLSCGDSAPAPPRTS